MRSHRFLLLPVLVLLALTGLAQSLKVMTYNIRYENPGDGENAWDNRKALLFKQIQLAGPDVFGIQEGLVSQVRDLDSVFKEYRHTGVGRDDGREKGEFSAIYYDQKKLKLLKKGTFWLSPTPAIPSKGWDAACIRICSWGLFAERTAGRKFWVFNTHFDHVGTEARKNSVTLILAKIRELNRAGWPVVLMGDFNSGPETPEIRLLQKEFTDAKSADKSMQMGPDGTFNDFNPTQPATERIDFIFTRGLRAGDYHVIRDSGEKDRFASDHFPVTAVLNWAN
ncbi:MAG TPA: endonuclease/exonuclease/phosphatase family protein [Bacteroidales bacterium]|nr:endonuclease/exonuclease/phosphatase family protein [Bacteroidales bacterium]